MKLSLTSLAWIFITTPWRILVMLVTAGQGPKSGEIDSTNIATVLRKKGGGEVTRFAEKTTVSPEKSRGEIEKILVRYKATGFAYGWENSNAVIMFIIQTRHIRFTLPLPSKSSPEVMRDGRGYRRSDAQMTAAIEQITKQRWRALALAIKAKLECVESGITTFEDEFLSHIVMPNGQTVGQTIKPRIAEAYQTGKMPLLLGASQ